MATKNPSTLIPPDDSGSDTFARYCYQAYHAFPLCLECALGSSIRAVILEHFEDIVLEYAGRWVFLQVKTRDPELGPWKLSDLLSESGAFHSLFRTYRVVERIKSTFEVHLEGAVKRSDQLTALVEGGLPTPRLIARIAKALGCSQLVCRRFLKRLSVVPAGALRESVVDRNLRLLMNEFPSVPAHRITEVHDRMVAVIHQAMTADTFGVKWPSILLKPRSKRTEIFNAKRLTRRRLGPYLKELQPHTSGSDVLPSSAQIRATSDVARRSLEPRILPRIRRGRVLERYVFAIDRAIRLKRQRIIPIVGPAGYGKSIIVSDLYDHFCRTALGWIALVRCDDLSMPTERDTTLDSRLGQAVSEATIPLSAIASGLEKSGRGLLFIDTLDLILDRRTLPSLLRLLRGLVNAKTTVVFTCRTHEFTEYFEPRASLDDLAEIIDRYNVPEFSIDESFEAARGFVRQRIKTASDDQASDFARRITEASVDRRPLREIVQNPLMLAMLCDLHGSSLLVPTDLTVSRLYSQYWDSKIANSRIHDRYSAIVFAKADICFALARATLAASRTKLTQATYAKDLRAGDVDSFSAALGDLVSEGVLTTLSDQRVRFFHQTLLEYAIARWLATADGAAERQRVLNTLTTPGGDKLHLWPIVRQLLTVVDDAEFRDLSSRLPTEDFASFRTTALAAGARGDGSALSALLDAALTHGSEWELVLCDALEALAVSSTTRVVVITAALVENGTPAGALRAVELACLAISAKRDTALQVMTAVFDALDRKETKDSDVTGILRHVGTSFLQCSEQALRGYPSTEVLDIVRVRYPWLGDRGKAAAWRMHFSSSVSRDKQDEFIQVASTQKLVGEVRSTALRVLKESEYLGSADDNQTRTALKAVIPDRLPPGWDALQGYAYARLNVEASGAAQQLLTDILHADSATMRMKLQAVGHLSDVARAEIVQSVVAIQSDSLTRATVQRVVAILRSVSEKLVASERESLAAWVIAAAKRWPEELLPLVARLATAEAVTGVLDTLLEGVPTGRRAERLLKTIRACAEPVRRLVAVAVLDRVRSLPRGPVAGLALVEVLRTQAATSPPALAELVELASGAAKGLANAAAAAIADVLANSESPDLAAVLSLARSRFPYVKALSVSTLTRRVTTRRRVDAAIYQSLCRAIAKERHVVVLRALCELCGEWARSSGESPDEAFDAMESVGKLLAQDSVVRDSVARPFIRALKLMVQTEQREAVERLSREARALLRVINSTRIQEADVVELLSAIARLDLKFTTLLVDDGPLIKALNVRALAFAIKRVDGIHSPLLDKILTSSWCPPQTRHAILDMRV